MSAVGLYKSAVLHHVRFPPDSDQIAATRKRGAKRARSFPSSPLSRKSITGRARGMMSVVGQKQKSLRLAVAIGPRFRTSRPPEQVDRAVGALLALALDFAVAHQAVEPRAGFAVIGSADQPRDRRAG
jgi:hypothetical protein